jgi:hypothetical protein
MLLLAGWVFPALAAAQVFNFSNGEQSYTVPPGVIAVHVVAIGAPGAGMTNGCCVWGYGGYGDVVSGDVPVPAGQRVLYVEVGGWGIGGAHNAPGQGGFNGGARGGASDNEPGYAGGGGGASDVRTVPMATAGTLASRLLVAGGGGGGSADENLGGAAGKAGGGGGAAGGGGLGASGGSAGVAVGGCGQNGGVGTLGQGGTGGYGGDGAGSFFGPAGGGGGGGYYGGGGGSSRDQNNCGVSGPGGAGGGGSDYVIPAARNAIFAADTSGTPQVTITAALPATSGVPRSAG